MCKAFVKKGILKDIRNKRIDVPANLQRNGWSYYIVHQFTAHLDLLYNNNGLPTKKLKSTKSTKHIPPTFYNLPPEERGNQLREWIKDGRKDLFAEYMAECDRDIKIELAMWDECVEKIKRKRKEEVEREIAQYESILPDHELDELRKAFRHRNCFNDRNGINQYNGLQTCPVPIYDR